jgi:uncharacterized membrane protein
MTDLIAGPAGPYLVILVMTAVTYACRASGAVLMSRVRITPRVERALRALPGSIVVSTVLPIAVQSGLAAFVGLSASLTLMSVTRNELAALAAGLTAVVLARAAGL